MKTIKLTTLFLVITCVAYAQKIHLTDTANTWYINHMTYPAVKLTYKYTYTVHFSKDDTLVNGLLYKKVEPTASLYTNATSQGVSFDDTVASVYPWGVDVGHLYREDTVQDKVWGILYGDSVEQLIYDGNWKVGDSISLRPAYYEKITVSKIDSVNVNAVWHKVFHFTLAYPLLSFEIIEGIGSSGGPGYPLSGLLVDDWWYLRCFKYNGLSVDLSPLSMLYYDCSGLTPPIPAPVAPLTVVTASVYPNPAANTMTVALTTAINGTIRILDISGRQLSSFPITDKETNFSIPVSSYKTGLYYLTVGDNGGIKSTYKFVVN